MIYCVFQLVLYCAQRLGEIARIPNPRIHLAMIVTIFVATLLLMVEVVGELARLL